MDPRAVRSRRQLLQAAISIGSTRCIDEVSVADIAICAGVNRSTFYQHARSPMHLLRLALEDQIDQIPKVATTDTEEIRTGVTAATLAAIEHGDKFRDVYRHNLGSPHGSAGLRIMLAEKFQSEIEEFLIVSHVPMPSGCSEEISPTLVSSYVAHGIAGAIESRLLSDDTTSPQEFLQYIRLLLPPWWPIGPDTPYAA